MSEKFSIEINGDSGEVDVILGHDKPILRGYKRDNIKMVGGWYFNNIQRNVDFLSKTFSDHNIKRVNFIGTSKSCSGAIVLTKELMAKHPYIVFNLFLFSAYTTVDKSIYIRRRIEDKAPGSLKSFWNSDKYSTKAIRRMEARQLVEKNNVFINMFYPEKSKQGEPALAHRITGSNVRHIGMPVWLHNTLYPLWKRVEGNMTIEIYESEFRQMELADYNFYTKMQNYPCYRFDLYSCVEDIERFIKNLDALKVNLAAEEKAAAASNDLAKTA